MPYIIKRYEEGYSPDIILSKSMPDPELWPHSQGPWLCLIIWRAGVNKQKAQVFFEKGIGGVLDYWMPWDKKKSICKCICLNAAWKREVGIVHKIMSYTQLVCLMRLAGLMFT